MLLHVGYQVNTYMETEKFEFWVCPWDMRYEMWDGIKELRNWKFRVTLIQVITTVHTIYFQHE